MLNRLLIIALVMFSYSCESDKTSFTINGTAEISNGTTVKLQKLLNNRPIAIDSTTVQDAKFTFNGVAEGSEMHFIALNDVRGNLPFILENGDIDITIDIQNLNNSVIKGTKENDLLYTYTSSLNAANEANQKLNDDYIKARRNEDELKMETIRGSFDSLRQAQGAFELKFAKENNSSLVGILVIERLLFTKGQDALKLKEVYDSFPDHLKQSKSGKNIEQKLTPLLATAEGAIAPNFQAPNPEGKLLALNDIKGKITIVDFWAAWCGPCRKENPNLVRVYEKYHDKGLEIVGVSLDGNSRQQDPKAAWIKAIKDDGLEWHQVSNLKYFQDPIAKAYNIQAIPASFILDEEGKIVAKELRGQALEDKIAELLN